MKSILTTLVNFAMLKNLIIRSLQCFHIARFINTLCHLCMVRQIDLISIDERRYLGVTDVRYFREADCDTLIID
jgi:hypothetical protein